MTVQEWVTKRLTQNPNLRTKDLKPDAELAYPELRKLTGLQFHARFVLPVKSAATRALRAGPPAAAPAAAAAPEPETTEAAPAPAKKARRKRVAASR